jgi:hypothetical protein
VGARRSPRTDTQNRMISNPRKARYWPLSSRCLRTTCPAQLGVHELCVSVADVLREDFDGVDAAVTDNVDIGRRADDLP